jgi:transcription elongation GreA/GreB family factor
MEKGLLIVEIDKVVLHDVIEKQLIILLSGAKQAAKQAYETATHEENKAENKYDTLGLEAAYLAEGQSKRVAELEKNLHDFKKLKIKDYDEDTEIHLGALVCLKTSDHHKYVFLSPVSGGVEFNFLDFKVMLITESSPLGKALKSSFVGDDIKQAQLNVHYKIQNVW